MRTLMFAAIVIGAVFVGGTASASAPQGVHGAGIQTFDVAGFSGSFTLELNATSLPTGEVVGSHIVKLMGVPGIPFGFIHAKPIYLEIDGDTACVVSEISKVEGFPSGPPGFERTHTSAKIVDVPGGPDLFGSSNHGYIDPAQACSGLTATGTITDGGFTIVP